MQRYNMIKILISEIKLCLWQIFVASLKVLAKLMIDTNFIKQRNATISSFGKVFHTLLK